MEPLGLLATVFCILMYMVNLSVAQDASACQSILNAGVYNTYQSSSTSSSYQAFQQAACQDYSSYSYTQYQLDTASSQASGEARSFNLAASAFGFSASVGSSSSSYFNSQQQFITAQTNIASYRQNSCESSSSTGQLQNSLSSLQQILDPQVYSAYQSCLQMYIAGVQIWQTNGYSSRSLALNVKFVPNIQGSTASFSGIDIIPAGNAKCSLKTNITGLPSNAFTTFQFNLVPDVVYSINCQLSSNASANSAFTDVYIYNTVSGAYHTILNNNPSPTQLATLQSQVATLQSQVATLQSAVAVDADGTINPTRICFNQLCILNAVGAPYGANMQVGQSPPASFYIQNKNKTINVARFSANGDINSGGAGWWDAMRVYSTGNISEVNYFYYSFGQQYGIGVINGPNTCYCG